VDLREDFGEVGWWRFSGGQGVLHGLDGDGAVAACGANEFVNAPTGLVLDPVRYSHNQETTWPVNFSDKDDTRQAAFNAEHGYPEGSTLQVELDERLCRWGRLQGC
jgi:hypothetical protein